MSSENPKKALMVQFAKVAKALGHEHRLEILECLAQGARSVESLSTRCEITIANMSQHLQQLRRIGLVEAQRDGNYVVYRLADIGIVSLLSALREVAGRNVAEVKQIQTMYFQQRDSLEPVGSDDLLKRLQDQTVVLLDVRPTDEYEQGHVPGALNVPLDALEKHLKDLPPGLEVIAYCRGPYCVLAYEAVALLRRQGLQARRLDVGYPEWKAAGLPTLAKNDPQTATSRIGSKVLPR